MSLFHKLVFSPCSLSRCRLLWFGLDCRGEEDDLLATVAAKYFPNGPPAVWSSHHRVWAAVDGAVDYQNRKSPVKLKKGKDYK